MNQICQTRVDREHILDNDITQIVSRYWKKLCWKSYYLLLRKGLVLINYNVCITQVFKTLIHMHSHTLIVMSWQDKQQQKHKANTNNYNCFDKYNEASNKNENNRIMAISLWQWVLMNHVNLLILDLSWGNYWDLNDFNILKIK